MRRKKPFSQRVRKTWPWPISCMLGCVGGACGGVDVEATSLARLASRCHSEVGLGFPRLGEYVTARQPHLGRLNSAKATSPPPSPISATSAPRTILARAPVDQEGRLQAVGKGRRRRPQRRLLRRPIHRQRTRAQQRRQVAHRLDGAAHVRLLMQLRRQLRVQGRPVPIDGVVRQGHARYCCPHGGEHEVARWEGARPCGELCGGEARGGAGLGELRRCSSAHRRRLSLKVPPSPATRRRVGVGAQSSPTPRSLTRRAGPGGSLHTEGMVH